MTFRDIVDIPELNSVSRARSAVEDVLERGKAFYRCGDTNNLGLLISLPLALQDALAYAGPNGFVASLPELIAAKVAVAVPTGDRRRPPFDRSHWLWKSLYNSHSEEIAGPNYTRRFYPKDDHLVVVVHGGGLLSPDRMLHAVETHKMIGGVVLYDEEEFRALLRGRLPDGDLPLIAYDDIGDHVLPRRCGIVLPYRLATSTASGVLNKRAFIRNPLMIARNAGRKNLPEYFDRSQAGGMLGNWCYQFSSANLDVPEGTILSLDSGGIFDGYNLFSNGRFVGVRR